MTDKAFQALDSFRTSRVGTLLFYGYLVAILITGALAGKAILNNQETARESKRGLCALQIERINRLAFNQDILAHPEDPGNRHLILTLGRPLIARSIESAKADLTALAFVECPKIEKK